MHISVLNLRWHPSDRLNIILLFFILRPDSLCLNSMSISDFFFLYFAMYFVSLPTSMFLCLNFFSFTSWTYFAQKVVFLFRRFFGWACFNSIWFEWKENNNSNSFVSFQLASRSNYSCYLCLQPESKPLLMLCCFILTSFNLSRPSALIHWHGHTGTDTQPHTYTQTNVNYCPFTVESSFLHLKCINTNTSDKVIQWVPKGNQFI